VRPEESAPLLSRDTNLGADESFESFNPSTNTRSPKK
jgi:hypothetical protein